jgi:shikimate 5-dehydrogenase
MIYSPVTTPFLADAQAAQCKCIPGWKMLLTQGISAQKIWTGREPPSAVMRSTLLKELNISVE